MPDVAKHQDVSLATTAISYDNSLSGHFAGEDMNPGDAVFIASSGYLMKSGGAGATGSGVAASRVHYYVVGNEPVYNGQPVTVAKEIRMHYGDGLTPGTVYYLSAATKGAIATTAPYVGAAPIALAIDTQRILFKDNWQLP